MSNQRIVLVAGAIHRAGIDLLKRHDGIAVVEIGQEPERVAAEIGAADALIVRTARVDRGVIERAHSLRIVARYGVGFDNVDVPALTARGIPLATVGDANARTVAEHMLYMTLALAKHGLAADRTMRALAWSERDALVGHDLFAKTLLVVGFGRIGTHVARMCQALGMSVLVWDPYVADQPIAAAGARRAKDLRAGLSLADVVTVHTPLNDETRGLIGADELAAMPAHAIIINCARGGIIDEAALAEALASRRIAGAGLDVFDHEPPKPDNPLLKLDNVVLSPHTAGLTEECTARMSLRCAQSVLDCFAGKLDPALVVNREVMAPA